MNILTVDESECNRLLTEVKSFSFKQHKSTHDFVDYDYCFCRVLENTQVFEKMKAVATELGYNSMSGVYAHVFNNEEFIELHIDTEFHGCDTIVLSLSGHDRLNVRVNGVYESITEANVLVFDNNSLHGVLMGSEERVSVVCWVKRKEKVIFPHIALPHTFGIWYDQLREAIELSRASNRDVHFEFHQKVVMVDQMTSIHIPVGNVHSNSAATVDLRAMTKLG